MKDLPDNPFVDIIFDWPPYNSTPCLVEIDDATGASVTLGHWRQRDDGYWVLRVTPDQIARPDKPGG